MDSPGSAAAGDIRNAQTPTLLGGRLHHPPRALWRQALGGGSTSTPLPGAELARTSRLRAYLELSSGFERSPGNSCCAAAAGDRLVEPDESPILFARPKLALASAPIFGESLSSVCGHS